MIAPDPEGCAALRAFYLSHLVAARMEQSVFCDVPHYRKMPFRSRLVKSRSSHVSVVQQEFDTLVDEGILESVNRLTKGVSDEL